MYFKNSHNIFLKAVSDINNNIRGKDSAGSHGCVCVGALPGRQLAEWQGYYNKQAIRNRNGAVVMCTISN